MTQEENFNDKCKKKKKNQKTPKNKKQKNWSIFTQQENKKLWISVLVGVLEELHWLKVLWAKNSDTKINVLI